MELRIIEETKIGRELDAAIREALCVCFPPDREVFSRTRAWHGVLPDWTAVLMDNDELAAHGSVVEREIRVGLRLLRVAGVQNVCVLPRHRNQGLCRRVTLALMDEASRRGLDFGLLFCTPDVGVVYAKQDWRRLDRRGVVRIDYDGREKPIPDKNIVMFYPLRRHVFPAGDIHLQGNDW